MFTWPTNIFWSIFFLSSLYFQYSVWNILWLGWNSFLICFYLNIGMLDRDRVSIVEQKSTKFKHYSQFRNFIVFIRVRLVLADRQSHRELVCILNWTNPTHTQWEIMKNFFIHLACLPLLPLENMMLCFLARLISRESERYAVIESISNDKKKCERCVEKFIKIPSTRINQPDIFQ